MCAIVGIKEIILESAAADITYWWGRINIPSLSRSLSLSEVSV